VIISTIKYLSFRKIWIWIIRVAYFMWQFNLCFCWYSLYSMEKRINLLPWFNKDEYLNNRFVDCSKYQRKLITFKVIESFISNLTLNEFFNILQMQWFWVYGFAAIYMKVNYEQFSLILLFLLFQWLYTCNTDCVGDNVWKLTPLVFIVVFVWF